MVSGAALKGSSIPESILYKHFFDHVAAFRAKADQLDWSGLDGGNRFRYYFAQKLSLTLRENEQIQAIAQRYSDAMESNSLQVQRIVKEFRHANFPAGVLPLGVPPPPPPAELKQLKQQRDAIIQRARAEMQRTLSNEKGASVDRFIRTKIAASTFRISQQTGGNK